MKFKSLAAFGLVALMVIVVFTGLPAHASAQPPTGVSNLGSVAVGVEPFFNDWNPTSGDFFVANYGSDSVSVISGTSHFVIKTITVGTNPEGVENVSQPGGIDQVWVTNYGSNSVSIINVSTLTVVATVPVGTHPARAAYDYADGLVFVTNRGSSNVSAISTTTDLVTATIATTSNPIGAYVDDDTNEVFITTYVGDEVQVFYGNNLTWLKNISLPGAGPAAITHDPVTHSVFVAGYTSGVIYTIGDHSLAVTTAITVPGNPYGLVYDPFDGFIFVGDASSDLITFVNPTNQTYAGDLPVGLYPYAVHGIDLNNGVVLSSNYGSNNVTFIAGGTGGGGGGGGPPAPTSDSALFALLAVILLGAAAVFVFGDKLGFKGDR